MSDLVFLKCCCCDNPATLTSPGGFFYCVRCGKCSRCGTSVEKFVPHPFEDINVCPCLVKSTLELTPPQATQLIVVFHPRP